MSYILSFFLTLIFLSAPGASRNRPECCDADSKVTCQDDEDVTDLMQKKVLVDSMVTGDEDFQEGTSKNMYLSKLNATLENLRKQAFDSCEVSTERGKLGSMRPKPGNMFTGMLQNSHEERSVIEIVRKLVTKHTIEINYVLDGPAYLADHAFALLHVLPGKYWTLEGNRFPSRSNLPISIPDVQYTDGHSLAQSVRFNNSALVLTWTEQDSLLGNVAHNEKVVMMPHGDDEDLQWYDANGFESGKILQRPFQDMAFSKYMLKNKYFLPNAVSGWLDAKLEQTFLGSPCHQHTCHGVVLITIPGPGIKEFDRTAYCKLPKDVWSTLVQSGWLLMVSFHPLCNQLGLHTHNLPGYVYIHDNTMGLSVYDLMAKATVIATASAGLLATITGRFIDKAVVRIVPGNLPTSDNRVWDSSMGIIHHGFDGELPSAVQRAFVQMKEGSASRNPVLAAREAYQQRYLWKIDGFEEYRNALAVLSLVVPDHDDLMELRNAVNKLTSIPFRPLQFYRASYDVGMLSWNPSQQQIGRQLEARNSRVWKSIEKVDAPIQKSQAISYAITCIFSAAGIVMLM